jgi:hypothetical protein
VSLDSDEPGRFVWVWILHWWRIRLIIPVGSPLRWVVRRRIGLLIRKNRDICRSIVVAITVSRDNVSKTILAKIVDSSHLLIPIM